MADDLETWAAHVNQSLTFYSQTFQTIFDKFEHQAERMGTLERQVDVNKTAMQAWGHRVEQLELTPGRQSQQQNQNIQNFLGANNCLIQAGILAIMGFTALASIATVVLTAITVFR